MGLWEYINKPGPSTPGGAIRNSANWMAEKADAIDRGLSWFASGVGRGALNLRGQVSRNLPYMSEQARLQDSQRRFGQQRVPVKAPVKAPLKQFEIPANQLVGPLRQFEIPANQLVGPLRQFEIPANQLVGPLKQFEIPANQLVGPPLPQEPVGKVPAPPRPIPPTAPQQAPAKPGSKLAAMREVSARALAQAQADPLLGVAARTYAGGNAELYDPNTPYNAANAAGPRNPGVDMGLIGQLPTRAAAQRSMMTPGGMASLDSDTAGTGPIPVPRGRMNQLTDMAPTLENGMVTRFTNPDGQVNVLGPTARRDSVTGEITNTNPDGRTGVVALPSSGNSLGLRQRFVNPSGDIETVTQSDYARRAARNSMTEEGRAKQELLDNYIAKRDKRRDDALDTRRRANAMRGYGQTGALTSPAYGAMGYSVPMSQPIYGQTGPSLTAAAGMVNAVDNQREYEMLAAQQQADNVLSAEELAQKNRLDLLDAETRNRIRSGRVEGRQQVDAAMRAEELAQQNRLNLLNAETENRIREAQAMMELRPEGEVELDKLQAKQAKVQGSAIAEDSPVATEVNKFIAQGKVVPGEVDKQDPQSIMDFAYRILTEPGLSDEAKLDLLRTEGGIVDYQQLENAWHSSNFDALPFWGTNNEAPLDLYKKLLGE